MNYSTLPLFALQPETKEIPLSQGKAAIVDAADYEWLNQWSWYANKSRYTFYAVRFIRLSNGRQCAILMHRLILDAPKGVQVDHRNGDGLNNSRANLRLATHQENMRNRARNANNTSGRKGVSWDKKKRKWRVRIGLDGRNFSFGLFADIEEATRAYDAAARALFGEFARPNSEER